MESSYCSTCRSSLHPSVFHAHPRLILVLSTLSLERLGSVSPESKPYVLSGDISLRPYTDLSTALLLPSLSLTPMPSRFCSANQFPLCWLYPSQAAWFTFLCSAKEAAMLPLLSLFQKCNLFFHCSHPYRLTVHFTFLGTCFSENAY